MPSEKLVRPVVIEGFRDLGPPESRRTPALLAVLGTLRSLFRRRAALHAEVFAPRHPLLIVERHDQRRMGFSEGTGPRRRPADTRPSPTANLVELLRASGLHHSYVWREAA